VIASPRRLLGLAGCLHGALRELKRSARTGDHRQALRADAHTDPDPTWGLHLLDANVALGNLIADVKSESAAYGKHTGQ
jgi:hypothetical protein